MIVPPIPVAVAETRMSIFLKAPPTNTTIIMIPVTIGGSSYKPPLPIESAVKDTIKEILAEEKMNLTEEELDNVVDYINVSFM